MSDLGNKKVMASNILYYMEKNGKTRNDMCEALGVKYTTFTDWVKANTYPRIDKIEMMANYFGISKSDLVESKSTPSPSHGVRINVLGRVAAGIPIDAVENIIDWEEIPEDLAKTGTFFGLKIKGDSMEPEIHDNDIVIVRQQSDAESGEIVIALVNGNDGACKRLVKYSDGISLVSINPRYEPMIFNHAAVDTTPVQIIGKVVELRRKL